jgi:hypothetical protein
MNDVIGEVTCSASIWKSWSVRNLLNPGKGVHIFVCAVCIHHILQNITDANWMEATLNERRAFR